MAAKTPVAVRIATEDAILEGDLMLPAGTSRVVLFAHGSGSSRKSVRNRYVAKILSEAGLGTLLFDLLTPTEEAIDVRTAELRFDIELLARRLIGATDWLAADVQTRDLEIGYFGASTGAAAAIVAAAERPRIVAAMVSRGGRPDLAAAALGRVEAPTLLIVGDRDEEVVRLNEVALASLKAESDLQLVPGATHLFEEPGALDHVAMLAIDWFQRHM
jgi:dienelactone hydrolase